MRRLRLTDRIYLRGGSVCLFSGEGGRDKKHYKEDSVKLDIRERFIFLTFSLNF